MPFGSAPAHLPRVLRPLGRPPGYRVSSFCAVRATPTTIVWGSSASVGRRQLSRSDDVPLRVEGLDREDITVWSPSGRTRPSVPGVAEVVPPFGPADRDGALFDLRDGGVDAGDEPVRERSARSIPVRQPDAQLGHILRDARPSERRRDVLTVARESGGHRGAFGQGRTLDLDHGASFRGEGRSTSGPRAALWLVEVEVRPTGDSTRKEMSAGRRVCALA